MTPKPFFNAEAYRALLPLLAAAPEQHMSSAVRETFNAAIRRPPTDAALWGLLISVSRFSLTVVSDFVRTTCAVDRYYRLRCEDCQGKGYLQLGPMDTRWCEACRGMGGFEYQPDGTGGP